MNKHEQYTYYTIYYFLLMIVNKNKVVQCLFMLVHSASTR